MTKTLTKSLNTMKLHVYRNFSIKNITFIQGLKKSG